MLRNNIGDLKKVTFRLIVVSHKYIKGKHNILRYSYIHIRYIYISISVHRNYNYDVVLRFMWCMKSYEMIMRYITWDNSSSISWYDIYHVVVRLLCFWINKQTSWRQQGKSEGFESCDRPSNLTQIGFKSSINEPMWPWNLMSDLENNEAPFLHYIELCASFKIHRWNQTEVRVRKRTIRVKNRDFFWPSWPWNLMDDLDKQ